MTQPAETLSAPEIVAGSLVAGRPVSNYRPWDTFPGRYAGHPHPNTAIVGYVVRETIRDGEPLHLGAPDAHGRHQRCGYDVHVEVGSTRYSNTFPVRDSYRAAPGGYAVVDTLYSCGCRS